MLTINNTFNVTIGSICLRIEGGMLSVAPYVAPAGGGLWTVREDKALTVANVTPQDILSLGRALVAFAESMAPSQ